MDHVEQVRALEKDLRALIRRYRMEFDLTLAAAIGTLEVVQLGLWMEEFDKLRGESDDGGG